MAGQATGLVMTELDDIVDRIIDQADPTTSSDAIAAAITAEQQVLLSEVTRVLAERPEISVTARNTKISSAVPIPYAAGTGAQLLVVLVAAALRFGHFTRDVGLLSEGRRCTALGPLIVALPLGTLALVDRAFALVGTVFAFVGHLFAFVGDGVALIGDLVPVVGTPRTACDLGLTPGNGVFAPFEVGGPAITAIGSGARLVFSGHDSP